MQVDSIKIQGYKVGDPLQELNVKVQILLLNNKGNSVSTKKETVHLTLVKDAACKSQAVCAPSFTNCKQCGAPMSLMAGRVCNYCGHARRLAEYDWAIRNYKVM
jgi:ribosomal protein L32